MDRLWAPWRVKYIQKGGKKAKCIFCAAKNNRMDYVIFKTRHSLCMLNLYPYNNGHAMAFPLRHVGNTQALKQDELADLFGAVHKIQRLLDRVLKPDGYNIGINISKSAGAGITGHLHIHIVPRWRGDTNFMPVVHGTKIISQSLGELQKRLKNAQSKKD